MSGLRALPFAAIVAVALGLTATTASLQDGPGFGAIQIGAWTTWPQIGNSDIDPYARASLAVDGALPLGSGEGLAFIAKTDDMGAPLDARCDYLISGSAPSARFWTLSVYDVDGKLRPNAAHRYGLTSTALLRDANGDFRIAAAREARPGNWLPLDEKSRFILILRAYQAATTAVGYAYEGMEVPSIVRNGCS
ncbi:DUF1214 domain-containing protein [Rhodoblastus acidophilus]|uniref:DUF1214 domain-containing protein n=1 Tax=Candidatus Rhodoblastus alkanivorans TaxID=2954117 RepID=A0ABS9Z5B2_9HYPH|nr:DUF1214 domain-containing protein [Candidatus Rhodoblastus alkanivorans]MCI4680538.1 DUF1214 domain-containing protein [Candidatus Rhodoblastus alkanivorans]MCI4682811.1 DUF1214 domain-containing protein [Candidatus Rhodoblastus alkanivorans]MDI4640120.1 DUF1214 domain-containing protein [Rhodoblastus acidophilus]